jgi:hypothetical protein
VLCEKSINHFWAREEKKKIREWFCMIRSLSMKCRPFFFLLRCCKYFCICFVARGGDSMSFVKIC